MLIPADPGPDGSKAFFGWLIFFFFSFSELDLGSHHNRDIFAASILASQDATQRRLRGIEWLFLVDGLGNAFFVWEVVMVVVGVGWWAEFVLLFPNMSASRQLSESNFQIMSVCRDSDSDSDGHHLFEMDREPTHLVRLPRSLSRVRLTLTRLQLNPVGCPLFRLPQPKSTCNEPQTRRILWVRIASHRLQA